MWTQGQGGRRLSGSPGHPQILLETLASAHRPSQPGLTAHPQAPGLASASKHRASWKEAKPRAEAGPVPCSWALPGYWEDPEDEEKFRRAADPELEEPRNGEKKLVDPAFPAQSLALPPGPDRLPALLFTASLQAHIVLSFQAYPTAHCVLLEVQVPAALVQPGQSVVCKIIITLTTS